MVARNSIHQRHVVLVLLVTISLWGNLRGLPLIYAGVWSDGGQSARTSSMFTQPNTSPNLDLVVHTVQRGETLFSLAQRYNMDVQMLQTMNRLKSTRLYPGQKLVLFARQPAEDTEERRESNITVSSARTSRQQLTAIAKKESKEAGLQFIWPLHGEISSRFGYRQSPMGGNRGDFHAGIDIRSPRGTPVRAAEDGEVITASYYRGYGRVVILAHKNDFSTLYAHNWRLLVRPGTRVKKGDIIALSGNSGRSTGPHLHFEIRKGEKPLNPLQFLD